MNVFVVYYAFLNEKKLWWDIVLGQLVQLGESNLLNMAKLYIQLCGSQENLNKAKLIIGKLMKYPYEIETCNVNNYEYFGINKVWNLAQDNQDKLILYFHSKGMTSYKGSNRCGIEKKLFQEVVLPYKKIIQIFNSNPNINKIGFAASQHGWIWFNFWWARGLYLSKCQKPVINTNRHYYESWIYSNKEKVSSYQDCYSLATNSIKYFDPMAATISINKIPLKEINGSEMIGIYGNNNNFKNVTHILKKMIIKGKYIQIPSGKLSIKFFPEIQIQNNKNNSLIICVGHKIYTFNELNTSSKFIRL